MTLATCHPFAVDELYTRFAREYDLIARDRDFATQVQFMSSFGHAKVQSILELFAGPALHSRIFASTIGVEAFCIDSSEPMRALACAQGEIARANYVLGSLPHVLATLNTLQTFDMILALRYSLGYLSPDELVTLIALCRERLRTGGHIFIELHDLDIIGNSISALAIRERHVDVADNTTLVCVWPDGPIKWDPEDWIAEMQIRLKWVRSGSTLKEVTFVSREWIHTIGTLRRIIKQFGGFRLAAPPVHAFEGAKLAIMEAV